MSEIKNGRLGLYGAEHSKCNHMTKLGFKGLMLQQRRTLSDLEWLFHGLSVPSVSEEHGLKELNANVNTLCTSSTL